MNNSLNKSLERVGAELVEDKASRQIKKARIQSKLGMGDYKLNRTQTKFLNHIEKKYGKSARKELVNFRNKTLAPLFLVQKKTREHGTVSTRDLMGITRKEWERAVESGENKIKRRGELVSRINDDLRAIDFNKRSLNRLETIKRMLTGRQEVDKNLIKSEFDKFLKNYNFMSSARTSKDKNKYFNEIQRSWKVISGELEKKDGANVKVVRGEINKILSRRYIEPEENEDDDDEDDYEEYLGYSLSSFYFRQSILNEILATGDNTFKRFYYDFISMLASSVRKRISDHNDTLSRRKGRLEFNEIENKVWGINKRANKMSGDMNDYYLKIEAEDFEGRGETRTIDQPGETKKAKKKIENERYNFLQRFKTRYKLTPEDAQKLDMSGIFSFIDTKRVLAYAKSKLGDEFTNTQLKYEVKNIIYKSTDEKSAMEAIDNLTSTTINTEKTYEKAFRILGNNVPRVKAKAIADSIIRSSKTNAEVERKLERAAKALEQRGMTTDRIKRTVLGDE